MSCRVFRFETELKIIGQEEMTNFRVNGMLEKLRKKAAQRNRTIIGRVRVACSCVLNDWGDNRLKKLIRDIFMLNEGVEKEMNMNRE